MSRNTIPPVPLAPGRAAVIKAPAAALLLLAGSAMAQATLREAADKAGLHFGAAISGRIATGTNTALKDIITSQFNTVVCENDMKWDNTERNAGDFTFSGGDNVVEFAGENDMKVRGHTLVWHSQSTGAEDGGSSREEMLAKMKRHIDAVAGRYKGKILEWDVVNEAVADGSTSLRPSFWQKRVGDDFIDSAFVYAHRADPSALLFYNDYGAEDMGTKSNGVYNLVKRLKDKGIPIHGVGLQCHFGSSIRKADIDRNIKRLGELGLRVALTEIDMVDPSHNTQPWKDLVEVCLSNANCTTFMTWGVYDAASWRIPRGGNNCNCLIYDTQLQPKDIHGVLVTAMNNADPAIVERRKAFAGPTVAARLAPIRGVRTARGWGLAAGAAHLPVLSVRGTRVDFLGRSVVASPAINASQVRVTGAGGAAALIAE
jgi:endo-1,4-beta-xylanase